MRRVLFHTPKDQTMSSPPKVAKLPSQWARRATLPAVARVRSASPKVKSASPKTPRNRRGPKSDASGSKGKSRSVERSNKAKITIFLPIWDSGNRVTIRGSRRRSGGGTTSIKKIVNKLLKIAGRNRYKSYRISSRTRTSSRLAAAIPKCRDGSSSSSDRWAEVARELVAAVRRASKAA